MKLPGRSKILPPTPRDNPPWRLQVRSPCAGHESCLGLRARRPSQPFTWTNRASSVSSSNKSGGRPATKLPARASATRRMIPLISRLPSASPAPRHPPNDSRRRSSPSLPRWVFRCNSTALPKRIRCEVRMPLSYSREMSLCCADFAPSRTLGGALRMADDFDCRPYLRSPSPKRLWASRARSSAAEAP